MACNHFGLGNKLPDVHEAGTEIRYYAAGRLP